MLIVFFLASASLLKAADVEFTITNEVVPSGNNGAILVDIHPSIASFPFVITIQGDNGYFNQFITSSFVFEVSNLSKGEYCINIEKADGCSINECLTIKRCMVFRDLYFCFEAPKEKPEGGVLFLLGNNINSSGILDINTQFEYNIVTALEYEELEPILDQVFLTTRNETESIINTYSSYYLRQEQNEIIADDEFVFKFFADGSIDWVVHARKETPPNSEKKINTQNTNLGVTSTSKVIYLSPNPFQEELKLSLNYVSDGNITIELTNSIGIGIESYEFEVFKGSNNILISNLDGLQSGFYTLFVYDELGHISTHKVLKL